MTETSGLLCPSRRPTGPLSKHAAIGEVERVGLLITLLVSFVERRHRQETPSLLEWLAPGTCRRDRLCLGVDGRQSLDGTQIFRRRESGLTEQAPFPAHLSLLLSRMMGWNVVAAML
jgi:hypothetical protein